MLRRCFQKGQRAGLISEEGALMAKNFLQSIAISGDFVVPRSAFPYNPLL
jgi:hypothetical protein